MYSLFRSDISITTVLVEWRRIPEDLNHNRKINTVILISSATSQSKINYTHETCFTYNPLRKMPKNARNRTHNFVVSSQFL